MGKILTGGHIVSPRLLGGGACEPIRCKRAVVISSVIIVSYSRMLLMSVRPILIFGPASDLRNRRGCQKLLIPERGFL